MFSVVLIPFGGIYKNNLLKLYGYGFCKGKSTPHKTAYKYGTCNFWPDVGDASKLKCLTYPVVVESGCFCVFPHEFTMVASGKHETAISMQLASLKKLKIGRTPKRKPDRLLCPRSFRGKLMVLREVFGVVPPMIGWLEDDPFKVKRHCLLVQAISFNRMDFFR